MVLVRLGELIDTENTGALVLSNLLSESFFVQEHLLFFINFLFHSDSNEWRTACDLLLKVIAHPDTSDHQYYVISGTLRVWLLHNVHANLDSQGSCIESEQLDKVLSYLYQECIVLKNKGVDNKDFLFLIHVIELCVKINPGIEYDNTNCSEPKASSSGA
ncbi:hypothetical protein [uncultured Legionella sp.]|uniref:hypothetical protein n=1 Tax=uncultured Legionella sp. TaxID=210934 RepID=UPI00261D369B|nr:hypothetical protein [uncultured Legionella sp.]